MGAALARTGLDVEEESSVGSECFFEEVDAFSISNRKLVSASLKQVINWLISSLSM